MCICMWGCLVGGNWVGCWGGGGVCVEVWEGGNGEGGERCARGEQPARPTPLPCVRLALSFRHPSAGGTRMRRLPPSRMPATPSVPAVGSEAGAPSLRGRVHTVPHGVCVWGGTRGPDCVGAAAGGAPRPRLGAPRRNVGCFLFLLPRLRRPRFAPPRIGPLGTARTRPRTLPPLPLLVHLISSSSTHLY